MKRAFFIVFAVILTFCITTLPAMADFTVTWQDNGYGNDGNWYSMDAFTFLADTSGDFSTGPQVATWAPGTKVNNGFAYATGPALSAGNFNMSVTFADQPSGSTQFEYFGYVNGTVVKEGIIMFLNDGSFNYVWSYADLKNAPQVPGSPVPIPAAIWLFGAGLLGLVGVRRRFTA